MSLDFTSIPILVDTEIIFSSKQLSSTESGIPDTQGRRNGFQSGGRGAWNTEIYCRSPWLADEKNFQILDALEWLKQ